MRRHILSAFTAGLVLAATGSFAADTPQQGTMKSCAARWSAMSPADKAKTKYKDHMSTCMKTRPEEAAMKPGPAMAMKPAPAMAMKAAAKPGETGSAKCKDGKMVSYKHRSGTCSGHGGVATWL